MGSLMPGWDANLGVPRGFADNSDKESEPQGYFARLKSHRLSHGGVDDINVEPSIARISAPPPSFGRSSTQQPKNMPPSFRSSTMAHSGPHASGPHASGQSGQGLLHQQKYQLTDWSAELNTLRKKGSLGRTSVGSTDGSPGIGERHSAAWWRSLEVGQLNEHPDAVPNGEDGSKHTTFMPQFVQEHKLDFGAKDAEK